MSSRFLGDRRRGALVLSAAVVALGALAGCGLPGSAAALGAGVSEPPAAAATSSAAAAAPATPAAPAPSEAAPPSAAAPTAAPPSSAAPAPTPAPAPSPGTSAAVITIAGFAFGPASLTVPAGATVMVVNQDGANHTVLAMDGSFDTGNIAGKATGMFTAPSKPGSYPYKCAIHPFMTGTLVVS